MCYVVIEYKIEEKNKPKVQIQQQNQGEPLLSSKISKYHSAATWFLIMENSNNVLNC